MRQISSFAINYRQKNMQIILSLAMLLTIGLSMLQCSKIDLMDGKSIAQNTNDNKNAAPTPPVQPDDGASRITLADAKKDFDDGAALFVDTRGKEAYDFEHVKGAVNLPLADFQTRYKELPKDKKIIAYCS